MAKVRIKAKLIQHSGVAGVPVTRVANPSIVCAALIDTSSTPFDPVGRVLSVIGRPNGSTPFASFNIRDFDKTTGTLTLDRDDPDRLPSVRPRWRHRYLHAERGDDPAV